MSHRLAIRARHRVRGLLARRWWTYVPLIHARHPRRHLLVRPDSGILIEGFPRSANTWAFATFEHANPSFHVGRHLHCLGHVDLALRLDVPVLILVRDPVDAVASYRVRQPFLPASTLLRDWVHFYRGVQRRSAEVTVATFEQITDDPGAVIRRVNERTGSNFSVFESSPATVEVVRDRIDELDRLDIQTGADGSVRTVAWPTGGRREFVEHERERVRTRLARRRLDEAAAIYERLEALALRSVQPGSLDGDP